MSAHLYRPIKWQEGLGYRVNLELNNGKPRCRASVVGAARRLPLSVTSPASSRSTAHGFARFMTLPPKLPETQPREPKWEKQTPRPPLSNGRSPDFARLFRRSQTAHNDPRSLAREALGDLYVEAASPESLGVPQDAATHSSQRD